MPEFARIARHVRWSLILCSRVADTGAPPFLCSSMMIISEPDRDGKCRPSRAKKHFISFRLPILSDCKKHTNMLQ